MKNAAFSILALLLPTTQQAQLSGIYTIGGASPDYTDVAAAVDDLMAQGVSGAVEFHIRPGIYVGQYDIGPFSGSSNENWVLFRSETQDPSTVTLAFDATSTTDNYIIRLGTARAVMFKWLTFDAQDPDFARAILFHNGAEFFKLMNCVLRGSASSDPSTASDRILLECDQADLGTNNNPDTLEIVDNTFIHGSKAIDLRFSAPHAYGVGVSGNICRDQLVGGLSMTNATIVNIERNRITTDVGNDYLGMSLDHVDNVEPQAVYANVIIANSINNVLGIGIGNIPPSGSVFLGNNMITVRSSSGGSVWGLGMFNLWDAVVVHNSVAVLEGSSDSKAFYYASNSPDGQDLIIRNNIFANYADGPALEAIIPDNIASEDHNDLFSTASILARMAGTDYTDLTSYYNATGYGLFNKDLDPAFPFLPDLHLNSCVLDGFGEYFLSTDIDGNARGNPACDMGADEFTYTSTVAMTTVNITDADLPYTLAAPNGSGYNWSQGATTQVIEVTSAGPYTCLMTDVNGCTYTVQWTVNVDYILGVGDVVQGQVLLCLVPARDHLFVNGLRAGTRYEVVDIQGRQVLQGIGNSLTEIDVTTLAPGVHVLRWVRDGVPVCARFIKE